MRIHSDVFNRSHLFSATRPDGVWVDKCEEHGSRKRARSFEVRLAADPMKGRRRRRNTGQAAATWDEHGYWMAQLFELDPCAIIGYYNGRDDFNRQTENKYQLEESKA